MSYIRPDFSLQIDPLNERGVNSTNSKLASLLYKSKTDVIDGYLQYSVIQNKPTLESLKLNEEKLILATYKESGIPYIVYIDDHGVVRKEMLPTK